MPWWHCAKPTGHVLILPLNCDELSSFISCYNSIPVMVHRVKNLNSALINLILQQKSFMIINIFSSWVSFHAFCSILKVAVDRNQSHILHQKQRCELWAFLTVLWMSSCTPSSAMLKSFILFQIRQITHQVAIFPPFPFTGVVTKCLLLVCSTVNLFSFFKITNSSCIFCQNSLSKSFILWIKISAM